MADSREAQAATPTLENLGVTNKSLLQIVGIVVAVAASAGAVTV